MPARCRRPRHGRRRGRGWPWPCHSASWCVVGVAHRVLHVADADAGDQSGRAEGAAQAVRADRVGDAGGAGGPAQCPAGAGTVHPPAGAGPAGSGRGAAVDGFPDRAQHRDGQRDVGRFGALAEHVQQLVAGLVAQVGDIGSWRLPTLAARACRADAWSFGPDVRAAASRAANSSGSQHGALLALPGHLRPGHGRRRVLAGMTPSMTAYFVERGHGPEPACHRRRRITATLEVAHVSTRRG